MSNIDHTGSEHASHNTSEFEQGSGHDPEQEAQAELTDHDLAAYHFDLPAERIAQHPPKQRGDSRMLVLDRSAATTAEQLTDARFADLANHLPPGAVLVANDSRVVPARIHGHKPTGGRAELLLLTPLPLLEPHPCPPTHPTSGSATPCAEASAEVLIRASKAPKPGDTLTFPGHITARLLHKGDFGRWSALLAWPSTSDTPTTDLLALLESHGSLPLPPYIQREAANPSTNKPIPSSTPNDATRYQTTYANPARAGSVAAPTAGLHFTDTLRHQLSAKGFDWHSVTLYVGYGTFSPVRTDDIRNHDMHAEFIDLPETTATALREAKLSGRPIIAIGTTAARTLEGAYAQTGRIAPYTGETDIFIYPGYTPNVIDGLITNFHLPGSSLIMLVSALAGRNTILSAYQHAIDAGYRFFSYGDAMLIK